MQRAAPLLSRALGASVGSFFGSPTAGAIVGGGATGPIRALGRATASGSGRDALATVANTPGAAGVPAAEAVQNMPFVEDMHRPAFVDWLAKQLQ